MYADCAFLSNPVLALFGLKTYRVECEGEGGAYGQSVVSITVLTRRSLSEGMLCLGEVLAKDATWCLTGEENEDGAR